MQVLLGFDGSAGSRDAIALVRVLCVAAEDEALLVNVLPFGGPLPVAYGLLGYEDPAEVRQLFDEARSMLPGLTVRTRTYAGDSAAHVITDLTAEAGIDLIVVGSPHRGALGRTFIGSVAEALLHGAKTPIAVAPRGYAAVAHAGLGVIALAYDGGAESKLALAHAEALAAATGAKLRVLSVSSPAVPMPAFAGYTPALGFDVEALIAEALEAIDPAIGAEAVSLSGPTAVALADACAEGVDLLVAGSRGYGPLGRVFVGSVTSSLICRSPCPVIVVPRSAAPTDRPQGDAERTAKPERIGRR